MIDFFVQLGSFIITPLYYAVSAVLIAWHNLWGRIFGEESGASWVLSIIGLTLVIRAALIPLFVKQIKSSRNMQLIQPKVKEVQKKYGHDRERLAQETMKLYKENGTNPFASCLPILLQMPIFIALFRMIDQAAKNGEGRGVLTDEQARQFADAKLFNVQISQTFIGADGAVGIMVMAAVLVLLMTATTFLTQKQLMSKNMPPDAMQGQYAQQQKMLLYILPLAFGFGGIFFPIGVLFYWTTSNLWTMGQQFYVIRRNPAPGTPAFKAKAERDAAKARRKGIEPEDGVESTPTHAKPGSGGTGTATGTQTDRRPAQRHQPQRQTRSQRTKSGGPAGKSQAGKSQAGKSQAGKSGASKGGSGGSKNKKKKR